MTDTADRLYERLLVLRCQTGDAAAFGELVARYSDRLHYYVRKMVQNAADPQDVVQDVWVDVFRSIGRLTDVGAFRGWLYRIAHDRACRQLRGRKNHVSLEEAATWRFPTDDPRFSAEDVRRIHAALDTLAADHREVLVLRFLEEMSYEDIAAVTGQPLGTIRSRLHYAKSALRSAIERMDHDE
jgi:RNA polymerase sigma-70 factor, ECF subfamily